MKYFEHNPRQITEKQFNRLKRDLGKYGDLGGLVHDLNSDQVISGNQRCWALNLDDIEPVILERLDQPTRTGTVAYGYFEIAGERFSYRQVQWTPEQCLEANVIANAAGGWWDFTEFANWDIEPEILADWGLDDEVTRQWHSGAFALDELRGSGEPDDAGADTEPQIDRAAELQKKWGVSLGQMWLLDSGKGCEHRLICGDCTDRTVVERVMGGEVADLVFTDPPYGNNKGYGRGQLGIRYVKGDETTDLLFHLAEYVSRNHPKKYAVVWSQWYTFLDLISAFCDQKIHTVIVWDKKSPGLSGGGGYGEQHEWATVFDFCTGKKDFFKGNVFMDSRHIEKGRNPHPTMKSVSVCQEIISDLSDTSDCIYDPFLGSGTTMVAANNLGRRCFGIEIEPSYCAVTLQRFFDHTGHQPQLIEP